MGTRKTNDQMAERLLELLMDSSKHFQETTTTEYNAAVGSRRFGFVAPHPLAGQRNLAGLSQHYHNLWKTAVESRLPGILEAQSDTAISSADKEHAGSRSDCTRSRLTSSRFSST